MEKENEYKEHIKESWTFAIDTASEIVTYCGTVRDKLVLAIFEKACSPYHYFLQNNGASTGAPDKPTEKQIKFATDLKIENPEQYSKKELADKIDEAKSKKN